MCSIPEDAAVERLRVAAVRLLAATLTCSWDILVNRYLYMTLSSDKDLTGLTSYELYDLI